MDYKIERNNDQLTIILEDPNFIGLQELLNTIDMFNISLDDILTKIKWVQSGLSNYEEVGSENAMIEISGGGSKVYDLYDGLLDKEELFPTISVSNEELKAIVEIWKYEKRAEQS